jgi:hypothetical protein
MKTQHHIQEFKVNGRMILINYDKGEIIFPEDIEQDELESIACYLSEEGFLEPYLNNNN